MQLPVQTPRRIAAVAAPGRGSAVFYRAVEQQRRYQ